MDFSNFIQNEFSKKIHSQITFLSEISSNWPSFILGSSMNNEVYLNSKGIFNYYLDFIYHFGFISLIPILYLIFFVFYNTFKNQKILFKNNENFILFLIISFSFLIEPMIGVSLKQPFIGILYYFIFGIYVSRLKIYR